VQVVIDFQAQRTKLHEYKWCKAQTPLLRFVVYNNGRVAALLCWLAYKSGAVDDVGLVINTRGRQACVVRKSDCVVSCTTNRQHLTLPVTCKALSTLSQKSETVAENGEATATVSLFCESVDRLLYNMADFMDKFAEFICWTVRMLYETKTQNRMRVHLLI